MQDWTISNVMVYEYNDKLTSFVMFPAFLAICIAYGLKLPHLPRVQMGSVVAVIGGIGLVTNPVTTRQLEHNISAGITFLSSWFWYPECTSSQFKTFAVSSVFFVGGFAATALLVDYSNDATGLQGPLRHLPSICCMLGEMGIFITWGYMVQNPHRQANKIQ